MQSAGESSDDSSDESSSDEEAAAPTVSAKPGIKQHMHLTRFI